MPFPHESEPESLPACGSNQNWINKNWTRDFQRALLTLFQVSRCFKYVMDCYGDCSVFLLHGHGGFMHLKLINLSALQGSNHGRC